MRALRLSAWCLPPLAAVVLAWSRVPLPGLCLWSRLFGMRCPGCGMAHAAMSLLRGDPGGAWSHAPMALVALPLVAGLYLRWGFRLAFPPLRDGIPPRRE